MKQKKKINEKILKTFETRKLNLPPKIVRTSSYLGMVSENKEIPKENGSDEAEKNSEK